MSEKNTQAQAPHNLVSDREYLRLFNEARHGSVSPTGLLRGIRACISAYEEAQPTQAEARSEREALRKIASAGLTESHPGHHNNALHVRCKSCLHRWCPSVEAPQHAEDCPAEIARAALATQQPEALAQQERDREDAERYRWLLETFGERRHGAPQLDAAYDDDIDDWRPISFWSIRTADDIDAAIDAARSSEGGQP